MTLIARNTYDGVQYQPQKNRKPYLKNLKINTFCLILEKILDW